MSDNFAEESKNKTIKKIIYILEITIERVNVNGNSDSKKIKIIMRRKVTDQG